MKKSLFRAAAVAIAASALIVSLPACASKKKTVTVYATSEDFRIAAAQEMFDEKFPDLDVVIEYKSTGDLAAKLLAEGTDTDCDIVMELENTYAEKLKDNFATLDKVDYSVFVDELVPEHHKYVPFVRTSGVIAVDKKTLADKSLPIPASYEDLLKPEYKGMISMPNPKSSSTGYIFLLSLVNSMGEDAALDYFDKLAENISGEGFTSSGSGPIKALKLGEAAIGLCVTWQAVDEINNGADYELVYFEEGSPTDAYSSAIIDGKQDDADIMRVFEYLMSDVTPADKEKFAPDKIYKDKDYTIENFPENLKYADMTGISDITVKENLLDKWKY